MSNSLGSQRSCAPLRCPHISTKQFVSDLSHSDLEFKHTMSNSCSNSYAKGTTNGTIYIENSTLVLKDDKELARRDVEDSNQLSPVSVLLLELQETHCDVTKPVLKTRNYVKRIQESSLAIPSSKLENPFESSSKGMQEVISSNFLAHHTNNKKAVLHSKPLLLDCVRETVEDQRKKQRNVISQHFQKILEAEELWNHIYENICLWSKDTIDDTNIEHLLHFDLLASMEEWNNCEEQRSEIGEAIVNATLNDIINEIIS
ncbi:hypothetical protein LIER_13690 [Lithospermum erythrorhizon]|uniref:DUF4378 domain-containing protein n=1 Tax=Lithospermum erythrorhizon TaxID=34254 RepID=A0AAV3PZJ8_LITER